MFKVEDIDKFITFHYVFKIVYYEMQWLLIRLTRKVCNFESSSSINRRTPNSRDHIKN